MQPYEKALALEWRAYIGSFIRTGEYVPKPGWPITETDPFQFSPNTQKLKSAPFWPNYDTLNSQESPIRLVPTFAFSSNADETATTGTRVEIAERPQLERCDWWNTPKLLEQTRL